MEIPFADSVKLLEVRSGEEGKALVDLGAGAGVTSLADVLIECLYISGGEYWSKQWLFQRLLDDKLPPVDDWLIGAGVPGVMTVVGALMKNPDLFKAGVGGAAYGLAMLLHHTLKRHVPPLLPPIRLAPTQAPPATTSPKAKYQVLG